MMFDGTYVARCVDLAPAGTTYDDRPRIVGNACRFTGEHDQSTKLYADTPGGLAGLYPAEQIERMYKYVAEDGITRIRCLRWCSSYQLQSKLACSNQTIRSLCCMLPT